MDTDSKALREALQDLCTELNASRDIPIEQSIAQLNKAIRRALNVLAAVPASTADTAAGSVSDTWHQPVAGPSELALLEARREEAHWWLSVVRDVANDAGIEPQRCTDRLTELDRAIAVLKDRDES